MKKVPINASDLVVGEKYHDTQHNNSTELEFVRRDEEGDVYFKPTNAAKCIYAFAPDGTIGFMLTPNSVFYKVVEE